MKELIVSAGDAGQRLDKYLLKCFPSLPRSLMQKSIRKKKIKVNRKRAEFNQILQENDQVQLFLPDDVFDRSSKELHPAKPITPVYEDQDVLILFKPAGLLSQKDLPEDQDTLNDRLLWYLFKKGIYDPKAPGAFTPALAHRLDRNTSGLVLAGKNARASRLLSREIQDRSISKNYRAIVEGVPKPGKISLWLKKEGTKALVSDTPREGYQEAVMEIEVLESRNGLSLIECHLETGRFHQIRASMAHLGHPLYGDTKYGSKNKPGYYLSAYRYGFDDSSFDIPETTIRPDFPALDEL